MVTAKPPIPILNTGDPIATSLVAAHPLVDGIGTTISDLSGNGYDGSATGGFTWVNDPTLGVVLQLDGSSAYVVLNAAINGIIDVQSTATVAMWLRLTNATPVDPTRTGLLDLQGYFGADTATKYPDTDGLGYFSTFRDITRFDSVNLGATNRATWHHLAITTISSGTYRVYVDGVEVGNNAAEFGVHATITAHLGRSTDSSGTYYLDGYIGDFRLWSRELAAPEVLTLVNDPWRMYTPEDLQETEFKQIGGSADMRLLPDSAMTSFQLSVDSRREPDAALRALQPLVDLSTEPDTAGDFVAVQVDVAPTQPTSFPTVADGRDPRKKPSSPVKSASPFDTDMVLAIPFAEGSGATAADFAGSAGGPHNATLTGTAAWSTGGFLGGDYSPAPALNPVSDYANITRDAELEPSTNISIATWVYPTNGSQTSRAIIAKLGTAGFSYYLGTETNQWRFQVQDNVDGVRTLDSSATIPTNTAVHLVATYDGTIMRIYVNGVEDNNIGNSGSIVYDITKDVRIGQGEGGSSFIGRIDDVRMWNNRILDADEVMDLYVSQFGMYCDQAVFYSFGGSADVRLLPDAAATSLLLSADLRPEPDAALRSLVATVDLATEPDTACDFLAMQVDVKPPVSNQSGLSAYLVEPNSGSIDGGTFVTVRGNNFENITDVQFGGVSLTGITTVSRSTITGTTGPHVPGLVDVTIFSASLGNITLLNAFAYVPFFGTGSDLLLKGVQIDPSFVRTEYFSGESAPLGVNTTLSFVLADYPVDVTAVEVYVRRVGENGGTLQRQGAVYQYTVDLPNRQIIWRDTATFALIATDEIIVRYLAQGAI